MSNLEARGRGGDPWDDAPTTTPPDRFVFRVVLETTTTVKIVLKPGKQDASKR